MSSIVCILAVEKIVQQFREMIILCGFNLGWLVGLFGFNLSSIIFVFHYKDSGRPLTSSRICLQQKHNNEERIYLRNLQSTSFLIKYSQSASIKNADKFSGQRCNMLLMLKHYFLFRNSLVITFIIRGKRICF